MKTLRLGNYLFSLFLTLLLCINVAMADDEYGICDIKIGEKTNGIWPNSLYSYPYLKADPYFLQKDIFLYHFAWYLDETFNHYSVETSFSSINPKISRMRDNKGRYRLVSMSGEIPQNISGVNREQIFHLYRHPLSGKWNLTITTKASKGYPAIAPLEFSAKDIECFTHLTNNDGPFLPIKINRNPTPYYLHYPGHIASSSQDGHGSGAAPTIPTAIPVGPEPSSPKPIGPGYASPTVLGPGDASPPILDPGDASPNR